MSLKLMYITNNPDIAKISENAGVDRIFVDMEYIGKDLRQKGLDTVQSHHTIEDIRKIKKCLKKAELLVRCNPIHDKSSEYSSSKEEIDSIIDAGADIIMLPFFKTVYEVKTFIEYVGKRAKTMLLTETPEAVEIIDEIINLDGIDEIYVGLNDLSLGYKMKFMFQLLADGTVERLCNKFRKKNMSYGFGGIAAVGSGTLPAEKIIMEHYRLGSECVILSRSFCNTEKIDKNVSVGNLFNKGISDIRAFEKECTLMDNEQFLVNKEEIKKIVKDIVEKLG